MWPEVYRKFHAAAGAPGPLLVTGTLEMEATRGEPLPVAEKLVALGK